MAALEAEVELLRGLDHPHIVRYVARAAAVFLLPHCHSLTAGVRGTSLPPLRQRQADFFGVNNHGSALPPPAAGEHVAVFCLTDCAPVARGSKGGPL